MLYSLQRSIGYRRTMTVLHVNCVCHRDVLQGSCGNPEYCGYPKGIFSVVGHSDSVTMISLWLFSLPEYLKTTALIQQGMYRKGICSIWEIIQPFHTTKAGGYHTYISIYIYTHTHIYMHIHILVILFQFCTMHYGFFFL